MVNINKEILKELFEIKQSQPKQTYKNLSDYLNEKYNIKISGSTLSKKLKEFEEENKESSKTEIEYEL